MIKLAFYSSLRAVNFSPVIRIKDRTWLKSPDNSILRDLTTIDKNEKVSVIV